MGSCSLLLRLNEAQPAVAAAAAEVAMNCRRFMFCFGLNENDEAKEQAKRQNGEAKRERGGAG